MVQGASDYSLGVLLLILVSSQGASIASGSNNAELAANGLSDQVVEQLSGENEMSKRAWNSLQSGWGKRGGNNDPNVIDVDDEDGIYMTGHFVPLVITDGTNTIDWNTFERLANARSAEQQSNEQRSEDLDEQNDVEKRSWKNSNVAWGKRRQSQGWNKFRGAWGKREPTWNNLKGMWGKRDQWQKLHAGWGKRSN
ncbi:Mip [Drosophila busckii]|uniref:Mip n=1 Tax=Drosophila busckii TaxID=30019 RepID=A0A0M3QWY1_DROBS|nr:allatostatins MIP [Drosophila busckii]ALC44963.1 Mip [Drosophila busckii]